MVMDQIVVVNSLQEGSITTLNNTLSYMQKAGDVLVSKHLNLNAKIAALALIKDDESCIAQITKDREAINTLIHDIQRQVQAIRKTTNWINQQLNAVSESTNIIDGEVQDIVG